MHHGNASSTIPEGSLDANMRRLELASMNSNDHLHRGNSSAIDGSSRMSVEVSKDKTSPNFEAGGLL